MKCDRSKYKMRDMTSGDPIHLILAFAVPLLIGNVFQEIYTMVDTMEMGYFIGDDAISAVGATSSVYGLMMSLTISLNSGYAIVITQSFGARDDDRLRRSVAGTLLSNGGTTILITIGSLAFLRPMLHFMNTPEEIFSQSYVYMFILCAGMVTTVSYNMFAGILRAMGNSRTPLLALILSSVVNIALDLFLILVLHLGIVGTALGTVAAQGLSAFVCAVVLIRDYRPILPGRSDFRLSVTLMPELMSSGLAMALMLCVVNLGSLIFQRANNGLGGSMIAAYAAARKIIVAFMQPLGTLASANSTFVSQNWGAKQYDRIRKTLSKVMGLEILWGILACVIVYLTDESLIRLITGTQDSQIVSGGVLAMRVSLPFFPVLGVLLCLRTAMQSMGTKAAPVASSCLELLVKALGAAFLIPYWGYMGTCVTEPASWVIMTVFLFAMYRIQKKTIVAEREGFDLFLKKAFVK